MANPRQTRKRRSGISKATQKPRKHHKEILSQLRSGIGGDALNQIVAKQWDPKETAARNYARLGLKAKLGKASGGVEKRVVRAESEGGAGRAGKQNGQVEEVQEAKIVRDKETGEVRVLGGEGAVSQKSKGQTKRRRLEDPLNDILEDDSGSSDDERSGAARSAGMINPHAPDGHIGAVARTKQATETWRQLHDAAEMAIQQRKSSNKKRKQSEREREWCQRLVEKHGNDYAAMARDIKVNVMQQSEGDLKKRIDLYLETR